MLKVETESIKPIDEDMDAAFFLADTDLSGSIDLPEFAKLYQLIKKGEVKGLGKTSFFGSTDALHEKFLLKFIT
jgi:hypothetical protein